MRPAALLLALAHIACARQAFVVKRPPDPSVREGLLALATTPVEGVAPTAGRSQRVLEATFTERFPETAFSERRTPVGPWDEALEAEGAVLSDALTCWMREVGSWETSHGVRPDETFQAEVASRCGVVGDPLASSYEATKVDCGSADALDQQALQTTQLVKAQGRLAPGLQLGVWRTCREGVLTVHVARARPRIRLDAPFALRLVGARALEVHGTVLEADLHLRASVTTGPWDARPCHIDRRAPAGFTVRCPVDAAETTVYLEIDGFTHEQPKYETCFHARLARDPSEPFVRWRPTSAVGRGGAAHRIGAEINQLRQRAGLAPLIIAERQSQLIERLAPHLLNPNAPKTAEKVTEGLMRGTELDFDVLSAEARWATLVGDDPGWMPTLAQLKPDMRMELLDPHATHMASASVPWSIDPTQTKTWTFIYRPVPSLPTSTETQFLITRYFADRQRLGLTPVKWLTFNADQSEDAAARLAEGMSMGDVLKRLLNRMAQESGRTVRGEFRWTDALVQTTPPRVLFSEAPEYVAVVVAPRFDKKGRGSYVLFWIWTTQPSR